MRIILAASPALLPLWAIATYGVNLLYWDELVPSIAGMFYKVHDHTLRLADLTILHMEHRIFVPKLIYLVVGLLTHGNAKAIMFAQWPIVCFTSFSILWLMMRTNRPVIGSVAGRDPLPRGLLFRWFVCNLLIFTLSAAENWLMSLGLINVMGIAGILGALIALRSDHRSWVRLTIAIACAWAASFSSASGLLCWPLAGAVLAWSRSWTELKAKGWHLLIWAASGALCVAAYRWGLGPVPPTLNPIVPSVWDRIGYLLIFLSDISWFSGNGMVMEIGGTIMLALYLFAVSYFMRAWLWRRDDDLCERLLPWLVIGAFTVINGLMGAILRADRGLEQASSFRYVSFAVYLPVSLVMLVPMIVDHLFPSGFWKQAPAFLAGPLVLVVLLGMNRSIDFCEATHFQRQHGRAALMLYQVAPDVNQLTQLVYPSTSNLKEMVPKLNAIGYIDPPLMASDNPQSLSDDSPRDSSVGEAGKLERISRAAENPDILVAFGWAVIPTRHEPADAVFLSYDDASAQPHIFALSLNRYSRPDVVQQTGKSQYLQSGWQAPFAIDAVPASLNNIRILAWAVDTDHNRLLKLPGEFFLKR